MFKFSKLFLALTMMAFLSACNDDDASPPNDSLLGTWTATAFSANIQTTANIGGMDIISNIDASASNFDYDVTFTDNSWTTEGSYTSTTSGVVNGVAIPQSSTMLTNVMGNGTYSTSGNVMTIGGSFFVVEFNGQNVNAVGQEQSSNYEINSNGELVFNQNEEITVTEQGVTTVAKLVSTSTWVRK